MVDRQAVPWSTRDQRRAIVMPDWLVVTLAAIFLVHLVVFTRLAALRGEGYYWLISCIFLVLTASFGLRFFAPEIHFSNFPLYLALRYLAWVLALITLPMLVRRLLIKRKG